MACSCPFDLEWLQWVGYSEEYLFILWRLLEDIEQEGCIDYDIFVVVGVVRWHGVPSLVFSSHLYFSPELDCWAFLVGSFCLLAVLYE